MSEQLLKIAVWLTTPLAATHLLAVTRGVGHDAGALLLPREGNRGRVGNR